MSQAILMQPLPTGILTFKDKDIHEGNYLYVDKTKWTYELIKDKKESIYFRDLRSFGKSLTPSKLKEIFEGNKEIFEGLWFYNTNYDWNCIQL